MKAWANDVMWTVLDTSRDAMLRREVAADADKVCVCACVGGSVAMRQPSPASVLFLDPVRSTVSATQTDPLGYLVSPEM